jgi:hypothetical protein
MKKKKQAEKVESAKIGSRRHQPPPPILSLTPSLPSLSPLSTLKDLDEYAESDVIIVGAGSAGLSCAYEFTKHPEIKVAIIEQVSFFFITFHL